MDTRVFKNLVIHELEYSRNFFDRFGMDFWVIIESRVNLKKNRNNSNRWKLRCKLQESARISRHRRYFLTKTVESSNVRTNFLKELIEKRGTAIITRVSPRRKDDCVKDTRYEAGGAEANFTVRIWKDQLMSHDARETGILRTVK